MHHSLEGDPPKAASVTYATDNSETLPIDLGSPPVEPAPKLDDSQPRNEPEDLGSATAGPDDGEKSAISTGKDWFFKTDC